VLGVEVPADRRGMVGYGSFEDAMNGLELAVKGKTFVAGERFSAADVYVGSQIGWGLRVGSIEKRPAFEAYWKGLENRPAAVRARAIDDALVPASQ
jgi:glutathione S-transferase